MPRVMGKSPILLSMTEYLQLNGKLKPARKPHEYNSSRIGQTSMRKIKLQILDYYTFNSFFLKIPKNSN